MSALQFDIITADRVVYSQEADVIVAPGIEGELGILPGHSPLMTILKTGELVVKKRDDEDYIAIAGGFIEVLDDKVVILADGAERAEEIDIARAEEAKRRAEDRLTTSSASSDLTRAEAALRRSLIRIRVAEHRKKKRGHSP
ncbi:MAG: F0F1 ATP synthase subunit epsilon [Chloroflexota bacterium]|nr:F0F1 ATP synthase subunit epsilon [Chloroflexota bacterium]